MDDLLRMLGYEVIGPVNDNKPIITVECKCSFEPNGRASETWESYWVLILHTVKYHWWNTKEGWRLGISSDSMNFKGESYWNVHGQALNFLIWYRDYGK